LPHRRAQAHFAGVKDGSSKRSSGLSRSNR
jgi:hypothetical protein